MERGTSDSKNSKSANQRSSTNNTNISTDSKNDTLSPRIHNPNSSKPNKKKGHCKHFYTENGCSKKNCNFVHSTALMKVNAKGINLVHFEDNGYSLWILGNDEFSISSESCCELEDMKKDMKPYNGSVIRGAGGFVFYLNDSREGEKKDNLNYHSQLQILLQRNINSYAFLHTFKIPLYYAITANGKLREKEIISRMSEWRKEELTMLVNFQIYEIYAVKPKLNRSQALPPNLKETLQQYIDAATFELNNRKLNHSDLQLRLPKGELNPRDNDIKSCAIREIWEETGYKFNIQQLEHYRDYPITPNLFERYYIIWTDSEFVKNGKGVGEAGVHEPVWVNVDDLYKLFAQGQLTFEEKLIDVIFNAAKCTEKIPTQGTMHNMLSSLSLDNKNNKPT